ncbi:amine oxidase [Aphelenchoides avenae]|nr:amine oxidase [Aphelenchus avenae]
MPEHLKQYSWLYFASDDVPFYRATMFSRYGEVTPDNSKYWSVLCECARPHTDKISEKEILDLAVKGLIKKGIVFEDQIESTFCVRLDYGYPIPTIERDAELARAHRALEAHDIYSRGRFGGWKYEVSNQDHTFMQGKEVVDRILLNQPETVYKTLVSEKQG